ncbi:MAG: hypothetical protein V8S92_01400 [Oscillospiraceae bacterium]
MMNVFQGVDIRPFLMNTYHSPQAALQFIIVYRAGTINPKL